MTISHDIINFTHVCLVSELDLLEGPIFGGKALDSAIFVSSMGSSGFQAKKQHQAGWGEGDDGEERLGQFFRLKDRPSSNG